jgi:lysophospholipase L1-like esterase
MATVWTFGDSLTEGFNPNQKWAKEYIDWKGYTPKAYGNFVSEILNCNLKNLGKAGSDNYSIFETFCKEYQNIEDDDFVIIGWSSCNRFRLANKENKWTSLVPNFENYLNNFDCISENTINEILINRTNYRYIQEVNNWIKFISLACFNKKIIHWSTIKGEGELNTHHFFQMEKIYEETDGLISDNHFSEKGQMHLADEIIHVLSKNDFGIKTNKLI